MSKGPNDVKAVVKKVSAFPFPAQFKSEAATFTGNVVKISKQGFLAEVGISTLQPMAKMECSFVFPVLNKSVTENVIVVKIYHRYVMSNAGGGDGPAAPDTAPAAGPAAPPPSADAASGAHVLHLIEFHFRSPSPSCEQAVTAFLAALERKAK